MDARHNLETEMRNATASGMRVVVMEPHVDDGHGALLAADDAATCSVKQGLKHSQKQKQYSV